MRGLDHIATPPVLRLLPGFQNLSRLSSICDVLDYEITSRSLADLANSALHLYDWTIFNA